MTEFAVVKKRPSSDSLFALSVGRSPYLEPSTARYFPYGRGYPGLAAISSVIDLEHMQIPVADHARQVQYVQFFLLVA